MVKYNIRCDCGNVTATVEGDIQAAGYCHCSTCRQCTGSMIHGFILVTEECIKDVQGTLNAWTLNGKKMTRHFCTDCGKLMWHSNKFPTFMAISASTLYKDGLMDNAAKPKMHLNYEQRVFDAADRLPKFLNLPEAFGGDGQLYLDEEAASKSTGKTEESSPGTPDESTSELDGQ